MRERERERERERDGNHVTAAQKEMESQSMKTVC